MRKRVSNARLKRALKDAARIGPKIDFNGYFVIEALKDLQDARARIKQLEVKHVTFTTRRGELHPYPKEGL